jgi:signal transduction histidine kinase
VTECFAEALAAREGAFRSEVLARLGPGDVPGAEAESVARRASEVLQEVVQYLRCRLAGATGRTVRRGSVAALVPVAGTDRSELLFSALLELAYDLLPTGEAAPGLLLAVSIAAQRAIFRRPEPDLEAVRAGERVRLARELHDRVGPGLSVAQRQLDVLTSAADRAPEDVRTAADRAHRSVTEGIRVVQALVRDLHVDGEAVGLAEGLADHAAAMAAAGVEVSVTVRGDEYLVDAEAERQVFLLLREGLHNAARHSGASRVRVLVEVSPTGLTAAVEDHGRGLGAAVPGVGMASMRDRARQLGGRLRWRDLTPGTRLELSVPFRDGAW